MDGSAGFTVQDDLSIEESAPKPRPKRRRSVSLRVTATLLLLAGASSIGLVVWGAIDGWLYPFWNNLKEPQAAVIASLLTIYAAALAAVLGPMIFTGQITSMQEASEQTISVIGTTVAQLAEKLEYVRKVAEAKQAASPTAPITEKGAITEKDSLLLKLEGLRQDAATLSSDIVLHTKSKRQSTKAKFAGRWPGRNPYIALLYEFRFITEGERALFEQIESTRKLTRDEVSTASVASAETALLGLKSSVAQRLNI
jgi:hypothetical protein